MFLCAKITGHRDHGPIFGAVIAAVLGIMRSIAFGPVGTIPACAGAIVICVLIPRPNESGIWASSRHSIAKVLPAKILCPNCHRAVAPTTTICPRCMTHMERAVTGTDN